MSIWYRSALLRSPEDGASGGGGGNGSGETPKALTEEDVGRIVNSAVTSQLKRDLPKVVASALGELKLDEKLAALAPKPIEKSDGDDGDGEGSGPGVHKTKFTEKDFKRQLQLLQDKLDAESKARQAAEQQRIEIETRSRQEAARHQFRSALDGKVLPSLLDVAVDYLGSRVLKLDESGNPILRVKKAPYKGAPPVDEDVPLTDGVQYLLASEDIKPFLPAKGGSQEDGRSGQRRPNASGGSYGGDKLAELEARLAKHGLGLSDIPALNQ